MNSNAHPPHSRLSEMLGFVGDLVENQKQRLNRMSSLASTVRELQAHYVGVEDENSSLRAQVAAANQRISGLESDLAQEQRTREALIASHGREVDRMRSEYDTALADISRQVAEQIATVREQAAGVIAQIRESAAASVQQAQNETDSMRAAYEVSIAENDKLNQGIETLMRAVEQSSAAADEEGRMIATMADIVESRRSAVEQPVPVDGDNVLTFDRSPASDDPSALNRVA